MSINPQFTPPVFWNTPPVCTKAYAMVTKPFVLLYEKVKAFAKWLFSFCLCKSFTRNYSKDIKLQKVQGSGDRFEVILVKDDAPTKDKVFFRKTEKGLVYDGKSFEGDDMDLLLSQIINTVARSEKETSIYSMGLKNTTDVLIHKNSEKGAVSYDPNRNGDQTSSHVKNLITKAQALRTAKKLSENGMRALENIEKAIDGKKSPFSLLSRDVLNLSIALPDEEKSLAQKDNNTVFLTDEDDLDFVLM